MKLIGTALLSALIVGAALGQGLQGQTHTDLWQPNRHIKDQNITLVPWGSGSIAETDETANDGAFSLRISTHNYFQGGFVKLSNPVDMSTGYSDANNLLDFTVRTADSVVIGNGSAGGSLGGSAGFGKGGGLAGAGGGGEIGGKGGGGAAEGGPGQGPGAPGGPGRPGGGFGPGNPPRGPGQRGGFGPGGPPPGFFGGQGGPPGAPPGLAGSGAQPGAPQVDTLKTVRVIIFTSDGKKSEAYLKLPPMSTTHAWREVAIPLQKINGFQNTNKVITGVGFSGDATSTYYVGDMRVVHDPTPITGEMNAKDPLNLALGDNIKFYGMGYGGATILKYSWSFDNTDGVKEDAVGQVIEHKFRKPGKFTVTLTIQDYYGLKQPFTTSVPVTVNP